MPRRHKIDRPVTRMMYREGYFLDKDSFVSLPDGMDSESHVLLAGEDWKRQRERIWLRDRGICKICGKPVDGIADPDHIIPKGKGGTDDIDNLRTVGRKCHNARHPEKQVQWTKKQAVEDFSAIYPKEKNS